MAIERRRILFAGHVQGVGFRLTTRRLAHGLPLVGFVRNLDDGRVELLIEGETTVLTGLVAAIQRKFGSGITDQTETPEQPGQPPFAQFSIQS